VILTGLTCIAVLAGNILTLLIAWAALDMVEALILVRITNERSQRERVVLNYGIRVSGSILVIAAGMVSNISGSAFTFRVIDPVVAILLLIGVGIRLGTIPPNKPLWSADKLDSLEVISRVAPAAASLAILPRLSLSEIDSPWMTVILVLASLAVIYGSLSWLTSQHAKQGISFWMMSVSGLAIIATIMGSRWSSMAWGVSLLLAGGIIFLYHTHHRYLSPLLLIASIGLTSLPYTPTWLGVSSYSTLPSLVGTILLCFQGFILVGYIRHSLNPEPKLGEVERWTWLVYPSGLILLLMVYLWFGYWNGQAMLSAGSNLPTLVESWPSLVIMLTAVLLILLVRITPAISKFSGSPILKLLSFNWLYRLFWSLFYIIRRLFSGFNYILEGQGGLLWDILLLLLLFSIFSRINIGF
jgi:hypothetical protein